MYVLWIHSVLVLRIHYFINFSEVSEVYSALYCSLYLRVPFFFVFDFVRHIFAFGTIGSGGRFPCGGDCGPHYGVT